MMIIKNVFILFILLIILNTNEIICKQNNENSDDFIPTKEWQVVKKGQKIPKGLHVRINFETGVTEAKLLDENDKVQANQAILNVPQELKNDEILDPNQLKKITKQYRKYNDLKKYLDEFNLTPKIDSEVMKELIEKLKIQINKTKPDVTNILHILEDLDFLSHQYDNARLFVTLNGFNEIIYTNLNSTNTKIRSETLKLLGSLMQNNDIPKIHALKTGCISILLKILTFDFDNLVKIRAATALGALIRRFPLAQNQFIKNGGLSVISKFFGSSDLKIQLKFVNLISDLIVEHQNEENNFELDLNDLMEELNWCENLDQILYTLLVTDENDHDSIEKCLIAMNLVKTECGSKFHRRVLVDLEKRYESLAINDVDKSEELSNTLFFSILKDICNEILHYVQNEKTEL